MQFLYDQNSGESRLLLEDDMHKYISKVRRHKVGDILDFRNLKDFHLYSYEIVEINRRDIVLKLQSSQEKIVKNEQNIHIAWCVVDTKIIEKNLPYLNELGVAKISFVYSDFSQKNFKLNYEKYEKILINSSQQCGRSSIIEFEEFESVDTFLKEYPNSYIFNFCTISIDEKLNDISTIIVGCEGGFSKRELELFDSCKVVGAKTNLIFRSETATTFVASKLLL